MEISRVRAHPRFYHGRTGPFEQFASIKLAGVRPNFCRYFPFSKLPAIAQSGVRQGKVFDLELQDLPREKAKALLEEIARKVLANPVIEEYFIEMGEGE